MCMGISAIVIWDGHSVICKWGDPTVTDHTRDSHESIRKLHGIRRDGGTAIECHPTDSLATAATYELVLDDGANCPAWWEESQSEIRRQLVGEIDRRMANVRKSGMWPGSLKLETIPADTAALTSIGGAIYLDGATVSDGAFAALTSIGSGLHLVGATNISMKLTARLKGL